MSNRDLFISTLKQKYPTLADDAEARVAPNLICPAVVELPREILTQAQEFGRTLFRLRQNQAYQNFVRTTTTPNLENLHISEPANHSLCMSYDFHVDPLGTLRLIEVNTNAAFLALSDLLYDSQGLPNPVPDFSMSEFFKDIQTEFELVTGRRHLESIAIVDDQPAQQRLYIEFLVFQEMFKRWGLRCEIKDCQEDLSNFEFIYNRGTDFYLQDPKWTALRTLLNQKKSCVSPQPAEYFYLADKARMIGWRNSQELARWAVSTEDQAVLLKHVPLAEVLNSENGEEIWTRRKNLFFKPQQAFGSKQSYKGASISRKVYAEISEQKFLAQELVPAPEINLQTNEGPQVFKYDLRFFAYQDRIQSVVARVYQGQVTNLQSPYGGFAAVQFLT
jgi:hypothetical protein